MTTISREHRNIIVYFRVNSLSVDWSQNNLINQEHDFDHYETYCYKNEKSLFSFLFVLFASNVGVFKIMFDYNIHLYEILFWFHLLIHDAIISNHSYFGKFFSSYFDVYQNE